MSCKKAKGPRSKSRYKLRVKASRKRATVTTLLKRYTVGQRVHIHLDGSHHEGLIPSKYQGSTGEIIGKQGSAYKIRVMDGNKAKVVITTPAHMKEAA